MTQSNNKSAVKAILLATPVLGYVLRWSASVAKLPLRLDALTRSFDQTGTKLNESLARTNSKLDELSIHARADHELFNDLNKRQLKLDEQFVDVKHRISSIRPVASPSPNDSTSELFADDHDLDDFYIKFENKFRGTEEEIKERQRVYIPYLRKLKIDFDKYPVLDIGCGRGEMLDLLHEEKIRCIGLDLNESMVERCKKRGFEAVQAEALSYLSKQKTGSLGVITGFHIVEHIPFNFLLRLFEECYRVLKPGGIIIFETPNPENLHVGSMAFYFDPSHLHPLVPDVLAFAVENRGFDKVDILRLHPKGDGKENARRKDPYVSEVLRRFYMEQDYSVIGYKKG